MNAFLDEFSNNYEQQEYFEYVFNSSKNEAIHINIDKTHLNEVLNNLLEYTENSIEEVDDNMIDVNLGKANHQAIIQLKYNGGLATVDAIEDLFSPQFSTNTSDTGIGLAICKRIIEFYKGTITARLDEDAKIIVTTALPLIEE